MTINDALEEIKKLHDENDKLRLIIAESSIDCIYCGLPSSDIAKCSLGFPGCGRADDLLLAKGTNTDDNKMG